MFSAIVSTIKT